MVNAGEHLDLAALTELKNIMGDEYSLLVETFLNDSSQRLKIIAEAVKAGDPDAIRRGAHSFKGSAGNMGAVKLTLICKALEELGINGLVQGTDRLVEELENEYQQVSQALLDN